MQPKHFHLGIDLGSISLKVVLLDSARSIVFSRWQRVAGAPLAALAELFAELRFKYPGATIMSTGITGSGRFLIEGRLQGRPVNEITAQARACRELCPGVLSIIEIGGQDSKFIVLSEDANAGASISDFRMNELCAAGTGAFLDQQATRLGLAIEEFSELSLAAVNPVPIAGRCAVFAKTDMTHHQQQGAALPDIVAGLNDALVRSYLSNMVRGRDVPAPVSFQGGVAGNAGLVASFRKALSLEDKELVVPEHHRVMGAVGAALVGADGPLSLSRSLAKIEDALGEQSSGGIARAGTGKAVRLVIPSLAPREPDFSNLALDGTYVGIDVGSVSVKAVVVEPEGVAFSDYRLSDGRPLDALRDMLSRMEPHLAGTRIQGAGITGSGRHFIGRLLGADSIQNEITAQARAAAFLLPGADTLIEIGGQDAKFMRLDCHRASHFAMNRVCAAGTGAFLQEQAERLGVDIEDEFASEAFRSENPAALGARCTVFMESDLVSHQQQGAGRSDLIAGLASSIVLNYFEKVVAGHQVGNNILFTGGVAENRAVVAALEARLRVPVATSKLGKISGALGAALGAFEARQSGLYGESNFAISADALSYDQFICDSCPNNCRITKTRENTFGGRCGKWDRAASGHRHRPKSLIKERLALLEGNVWQDGSRPAKASAKRVGIPRALLAFDRLPAWRAFFEELGCEIVLSPPTDDAILALGMKKLVVENCLPVKAFCSHICWLEEKGSVDLLFVPSFVSTGRDAHGKETFHCPYIQSAVQFARPVTGLPILNPVVNWRWNPRDEERAMAAIAAKLGATKRRRIRAWKRAAGEQLLFRIALRRIGAEVLSGLAAGKIGRALVLLGKDYNICDPRLSSNAAGILESMGEVVLTQDMLADDGGAYSEAYRQMYWSHGKEILAAAEIAAKTPGLYPVFVTSFGCGPDSFTLGPTRDIMRDKPLLVLEVDEHSSSVGMETRIEAFLDSIEGSPAVRRAPGRAAFRPTARIRRVYLPNFSDHSIAFAAAIRSMGLEPVLTSLPDDEAARLGSLNAASGECHPYSLMLGSYLKAASGGVDAEGSCFMMPESGACRVGLFGLQMRLAAEGAAAKLPIITQFGELRPWGPASTRAAFVRMLLTYWEMMRGMDFLLQKFFETRARETTPGSTERAMAEGRKVLWKEINADTHLKGLRRALALLNAVEVDRDRELVSIGITGDYYTRICDYANGNIFRDIERMGGVIMLPPTMSEFVKYNAHQRPAADFRHRHAGEFLQSLAVRGIVGARERRVRRIFDGSLSYGVPLEYNRSMKLIEKYMDPRLPAGLTGSVAATMEQLSAGANGILNLITFHCTYGLVLSSVLQSIGRDFPDVPRLTLIFEGLKPAHNRTRLEAFMERVREKRQSKEVIPCS
ncbi:MAG: acyl-CoA dehydratase activase [Pseudomonadota bacterium]